MSAHPANRRRGTELLLFLLLWATFAYFHHSTAGWNVNSRLALTFALVERGTVRIDEYWNRPDLATEDVAVYGGHYYCDKIIGTSLLGVPSFCALRVVEIVRGSVFATPVRRYVVTVFSVGLLAAMSGVVLLRLLALLLRGSGRQAAGLPVGRPGPAVFIACATLLGTQLLFYATLFMSYLPAVFFILCALLLVESWRAGDRASPPVLACGILSGCAVLCEYTFALSAVLAGLYLAWQMRFAARSWLFWPGMLLPLLPFLVYTVVLFSRLALPYQYEMNADFREGMARGFLGTTTPRLAVLYLITLHPFRGLFAQAPFLLVALAGLWRMVQCQSTRGLGMVIGVAAAGYLLHNSSYYMWWGGWSFGPRHLVPLVPLLALCLPSVWSWRVMRYLLIMLACWSVGVHVIVNSVDPQMPDRLAMRMVDLWSPSFEGRYPSVFPRYVWPLFTQGTVDVNAGMLLGLRGPSSLLPLAAMWMAGALGFVWLGRREAPPDSPCSQ